MLTTARTTAPTADPAAYTCPVCTARALPCDGDCLATLHKTTAPKEGRGKEGGKADNGNCQNEPPPAPAPVPNLGGPRTPAGKAVAARSALADPEGATTHGLFSRDVVLPSLGEDPEGYRQLEAEFMDQIAPRTLVERYYVEQIAGASWRLRRLHRWQAQLFEDESVTEDQRLGKLDKVLRHETALRRQVDTAVRMLGREVPQMYKGRARDQALLVCMQTEAECRENRENALEVEYAMRERLCEMAEATAAPPVDLSLLDTLPSVAPYAPQNCQNEPAPSSPPPPAPPPPVSGGVAGLPAGVGSSSPSCPPRIGGRGASLPSAIVAITRDGRPASSASHPHGWPVTGRWREED